jgi:hypothetical protein
VSTKGTGKYVADYVNWARVAHLLHQHAPGWQFHLSTAPNGSHVWEAPNQTAYVVGHFVGPDGQCTPDFPQAVMNNRNEPVPMKAVSARDVTDTHRRCLCSAAAFTFGLAWQLWAKESLEDPHAREADHSQPSPAGQRQAPAQQQAATALSQARQRAMAAGLTPTGAAAAALELTNGTSRMFSEIPEAALKRIAEVGITPETVARWNKGPEADQTPATAAAAA